jgi:hypothetical protein
MAPFQKQNKECRKEIAYGSSSKQTCGGMLPDFKGVNSNTSHLEKFIRFEE